MSSSKLLVVYAVLLVVLLISSHSFARHHGHEKGPGKFHSKGGGLAHAKEGNVKKGCHFAGTCSNGGDCRQACAALGRNPDAVQCVSSTGEVNRCCCIEH